MKINNIIYSNPKQAVLPMLIQDYLDICDPVLTFDRFMGEIELEKYLKNIPQHDTGRLRYDPVSMLKTVLFGFMANGYISLRELEDQCKVNLRFMYLMDHQAPSYRTFGYFINEVLADSIKEIFQDINKKSSRQNMWISNIYTLMDPSLKQMRINTPGYGKKQPKNPDTVSLVRSLHSLRKSMRNFHVQV